MSNFFVPLQLIFNLAFKEIKETSEVIKYIFQVHLMQLH